MAFGLKKKARDAESPAAVEPAQPAVSDKRGAGKKRKPAELLSGVVNESAVGAAIDTLKRNAPFALPNGESWVGLLLNVDEIGGLNKKQKGDATKGSIIELIAADKIEVVATRSMLDQEFLGIVPSAGTLDRMEEYRILVEAPYYWGVFRAGDDGNSIVVDTVQDVPATFAHAAAVSRGENSLSDILPHVWSWAAGTAGEPVLTTALAVEEPSEFDRLISGEPARATASVNAASEPVLGTATATVVDNDPLAGAFDLGISDDVDFASLAADDAVDLSTGEVLTEDQPLEFDEAQFEAQFTQSADDGEGVLDAGSWNAEDESESEDAEQENGYFQYLEDNRDRVVDEQEVRDTIARRFLSNDLDLVVDLAEFERVFGSEAQAVKFEVAQDASDWLGSQVAQLSRQANTELSQLHRAHADELRQLFVETMALHVETTMTEVSTETPGSQYAALMDGAKRDFEDMRQNAPREVAELRREIQERFDAAANSRAEQAAAHARTVYEDKHRPKLERDLAEVGLDFDRRVEEQYAHDRQTVLEMRRKDANVRMDVGTNRIFEHLREVQAQQRESEREAVERWNMQLIQFIDENRKDDIARAMVLAEELSRNNQVQQQALEHKAQVRELRQEHSAREENLQAELTRIRQEALDELESRKQEWRASIELEKERTSASTSLSDELRKQLGDLGERYAGQYESRIATLEADKEAAALELQRSENARKSANRMMIMLIATLSITAAAIGVIAGWAWGYNLSIDSAAASTAIGTMLT